MQTPSSPISILKKVQQRKIIILCLIFISLPCPQVHSPRCRSSSLPFGVSIVRPCSFQPRYSCKVTCKHNGVTKWKTLVHCRKHGKWSPLPMCVNALHTRSLEPVDCDKLPVNVQNKAFCAKIKLPKQNQTCPELLNVKMDLTDCPREANSHCIISCGDSYTNITCLPNGTWSHMPVCKSSRENLCIEPEIGTLVNCSRREGEKCQIRCPGGNLMNENVMCLSSGTWALVNSEHKEPTPIKSKGEIISKCTCPSPNVTEEFNVVESCDNKNIGEKCYLGCKPQYSLIGRKTIVCRQNATWSDFPLCSDKTCPIPELSDSLQFKENCSIKRSGQSCKLECQGKLQIIEKKPFRCVNGTHWTKLPVCACFPPVLPELMTTKETCQETKIGNTCQLQCTGRNAISGSNIITCQSDGNWTTLPKCVKTSCSKPELIKPLIFSEDCVSKNVGETCELECLNTEGIYEISCLNDTHWSPLPKCSCPIPSLSQNIELMEDCSSKKPGEKCKVSCKDLPTLEKHMYITCQNNSQWSDEPLCNKVVCHRPVLPNYLLFDEDCTNIGNGERCKLICKMGGNLIHEESIECLKGISWSRFPICTCPTPYIREDLEAVGDCSSKKPGEKCIVQCKEDLTVTGNEFILCKNDTTWTSQPSCTRKFCGSPELPSSLSLERDCSSKSVGEECKVYCKEEGNMEGSNIIACLDNFEWSSFPSCTCQEPNLTKDLLLKDDCKNKEPGGKCEITCSGNLTLVGNNIIHCLPEAKWSSIPRCAASVCSEPKLPQYLAVAETCLYKIPGDTCEVKCNEGGKIIGKNFMICLNETNWSSAPTCTCPQPTLGNYLTFLDDCKSKFPGEKCNLKCPDKSELIGESFITCENSTKWSSQPTCNLTACPNPVLTPVLKFSENCTLKQPGETCELVCKEGGNTLGENTIKCFDDLKWSNLPICTCPFPDLNNDITPLGNCSNKTVGENCYIRCREAFFNISFPYITCLNNTKWSEQPKCIKNFCSDPILPSFLMFEDICSSKTPGDECLVKCKEGGEIIGNPVIKCLNLTTWTEIPDCGCFPPLLDKDLESTYNCTQRKRGDKCNLRCKEGKSLIGNSFITCQTNQTWSTQPMCGETKCRNLKFSPTSIYSGICENKSAEELCFLRCRTGGEFIDRKNYITCRKSGRWSRPEKCFCPILVAPPEEYILKENCSEKLPGEECLIACKNGFELKNNGYIKCDNSTQWTAFPPCEKNVCPPPTLINKLKISEENCNRKKYGDSCKLSCENKGFLSGIDSINCNDNGSWSSLPNCTCPKPTLPSVMELEENCEGKKVGERCFLSCKLSIPDNTSKDSIVCIMEQHSMWSTLPNCSCSDPTHFFPGIKLNEDCKDLSSFEIGQTCNVYCENTDKILNGTEITCVAKNRWSPLFNCTQICPDPRPSLNERHVDIKPDCIKKVFNQGDVCNVHCLNGGLYITEITIQCLSNGTWSNIPSCSCPPPPQDDTFQPIEDCTKKFDGHICNLRCRKRGFRITPGRNFLRCMAGQWKGAPSCQISCPDPKAALLINSIGVLPDCAKKQTFLFNESCAVRCLNGGLFITRNRIQCLITGKWSPLPRCSCPPPELNADLQLAENCTIKFHNDKCTLACKAGFRFKEDRNFVKCVTNKWNSLPVCEPVPHCIRPPIPPNSLLLIKENCDSKYEGETCQLGCKNDVSFINTTKSEIACMPGRVWSAFPVCACKKVTDFGNWKVQDNCDQKEPGDFCSIFCIQEQKLVRIKCLDNGQWTEPVC